MNVPTWTLLGFAAWTLITLLLGVGLVRWRQILAGSKRLNEFPADVAHGSPRYRRAMRAHANCVENLPVYAAVVLAANAVGATGGVIDDLACVYLGARVLQTATHVLAEETSSAVGLRFAFFFTQLACVAWMGISVARLAG